MQVNTDASPIVKAIISNKPNPIRCKEIAANKTTSAEGQGKIPPDTSSAKSCPRLPAIHHYQLSYENDRDDDHGRDDSINREHVGAHFYLIDYHCCDENFYEVAYGEYRLIEKTFEFGL